LAGHALLAPGDEKYRSKWSENLKGRDQQRETGVNGSILLRFK
jgi:hypothetical protein